MLRGQILAILLVSYFLNPVSLY